MIAFLGSSVTPRALSSAIDKAERRVFVGPSRSRSCFSTRQQHTPAVEIRDPLVGRVGIIGPRRGVDARSMADKAAVPEGSAEPKDTILQVSMTLECVARLSRVDIYCKLLLSELCWYCSISS